MSFRVLKSPMLNLLYFTANRSAACCAEGSTDPGRPSTTRDTEVMVKSVVIKSVEGIYRDGKVDLVEPLTEAEGSREILTWVHPAEPVDLSERGIDRSQAADLRHRLAAF